MRLLRLLPAVVLAAGGHAVASRWGTVTEAYTDPPAPAAEIQFAGIDLTVEPSPIEPSPFWFAPAVDTRQVPVELAYQVDAEVEAPVMIGGAASLEGTVRAAEGPLPGAVVRLERHTGGGMAVIDVTADPQGRWKVPGLRGGRYRVRAWVPGEATMAGSEVFFLGGEDSRSMALAIEAVDATPRMRFDHRGDIFFGGTGTVAVSVTTHSVDSDGFVVVSAVAGAIVTLAPSGPMTLAGGATVTADGEGVARFVLSCPAPGSGSAIVVHQSQSMPVVLPSCVEPPPPDPSEADPSAPTSTTAEAVSSTHTDPGQQVSVTPASDARSDTRSDTMTDRVPVAVGDVHG